MRDFRLQCFVFYCLAYLKIFTLALLRLYPDLQSKDQNHLVSANQGILSSRANNALNFLQIFTNEVSKSKLVVLYSTK